MDDTLSTVRHALAPRTPLAALGLSPRAYHALIRGQVTTVEDALMLYDDDPGPDIRGSGYANWLLTVRGIGPRTLEEIDRALALWKQEVTTEEEQA
jgi:hypothetical protein